MRKLFLGIFLCMMLFILTSCKYVNKTFFKDSNSKIILHRGLSCIQCEDDEYAPENTIPAFKNAAKTNCFGIETDIQETKDNVFVCFHDIDLKYNTTGTKYIQDYTYDELNYIHINKGANIDKYSNLSIPKLEDFLKICLENNKKPFLDLKNIKHYDKMFELILKYFTDYEVCICTGFEDAAYESTRTITPSCFCSLDFNSDNYSTYLDKYKKDKNLLYCFDIKDENVESSIIDSIKDEGYLTASYVINSTDKYNKCFNDLKVDYIFTDKMW